MSLNALHSFFWKISRSATIAVITAITLLFFWLINFRGVPGIPPITSLLHTDPTDMVFTHSPSSIYEMLTQFGADGRSAYGIFLERLDFLFPAVYGLFLLASAPSASHSCSPTTQRYKNSACFPCSPHSSTTPRTSASSQSDRFVAGGNLGSATSQSSPSRLRPRFQSCYVLRAFFVPGRSQ
jgi:hypothetical protein